MNSEFLKKNFVTILMVAATVILAGVAIFTALRLYQLRSQPVSPSVPASTPAAQGQDDIVGIRPRSGNENQPETFILTNNSDETLELVWQLDCWDETICEDESGSLAFEPGATFEKGFGVICSRWQLDVNWSGNFNPDDENWDWGALVEVGPQCEGATQEDVTQETEETSRTTSQTQEGVQFETTACTQMAFSLSSSTPTPTATPTETATATPTPSPTDSPTPSPTPTTTATATPAPTSTPTSSPTTVAQATPSPTSTAAALPDAGIATPTVLGLGAGILLLLGALVLAL